MTVVVGQFWIWYGRAIFAGILGRQSVNPAPVLEKMSKYIEIGGYSV